MFFARRVALLFISVISLLIYYQLRSRDYGAALVRISQSVGLGEYVDDDQYAEQEQGQSAGQFSSTPAGQDEHGSTQTLNTSSPVAGLYNFPEPELKSVYTRAVVMGRLSTENVSWLEEANIPNLMHYIYVVDDKSVPLHTSRNKGHEAMPYLTYIIDNYDNPELADVNIFMHAHRVAWHTPELLNHDAIEVLRRLSSERVVREGYTNLRCYWDPGCPERIYPGRIERDKLKVEQHVIANAWPILFPGEPIPEALGAPCCGQFAVSRQRIRALPKERYQRLMTWLTKTGESDWVSGRVFEYLWQKIFTGMAKVCPDARVCYCDGYGVCFGSDDKFEEWFGMKDRHGKLTDELKEWDAKAQALENASWHELETMELDIPLPGRNVEIQRELDSLYARLGAMREEAFMNGTSAKFRAEVAGRPWTDGDGY